IEVPSGLRHINFEAYIVTIFDPPYQHNRAGCNLDPRRNVRGVCVTHRRTLPGQELSNLTRRTQLVAVSELWRGDAHVALVRDRRRGNDPRGGDEGCGSGYHGSSF